MAKQVIQLGTVVNDGTGDPLRTAFTKTNENFTELYTAVGTIPTNTNQLTNGSGFITSSTLSGYALTSAIPTNTNQLTNGSGFITANDIPTIPSDISDLTDTESLLSGSESSDRLVNGEYEFVLDADGNLTAPKDILVGGGEGGHIYIDGTGGNNVSVRWINMPSNEDYSIIRAYTGNPAEETDLSRGRIQLAWQDETHSGMRIISYDRTDEENVITHNWTFQGDGGLILPEGGTIVEGVLTDNPTIELTPANPDVSSQKLVIKGGVFGEPTDYHLHLTTGDLAETSIFLGTDDHNVRTTTDGKIQITTLGDNTNIWEFGTDGTLTFPSTSGKINPSVSDGGGLQIEAETDFEIKVNQFEGEPAIWSFAGTDITFPDDTVQTTAWTGILPNPTYSGSDEIGEATPAPLNLNNSAASTLLTQLNLINTGGGPGAGSAIDFWTYTTINDVPQVRLQAVDDGNYSADFAIKIKANGNGGNGNLTTTWTFGADGKLTVPGDIIGYQAYVSETPADERVTIQPSGSVDKPFLFTTDQTNGTWERSSMELPSAEINKAVSLGFPHNNITTGYIYNQGTDTLSGTEFNNAFNIMSNGTDVKISTVSGGGNKVWKFAQDGDITLPASGDVLDSTGVSQLANRVEGSWTVTAGTNTYSFTVPSDGTYVMWVKGNIPNGIITWNATLSVSNSNVPAIGTQYAWNYTGGGSPILLTAIPDQIKGTAGGISTDNTYVGTTSNRFDFGISNTSGATQTVYYGYTKV